MAAGDPYIDCSNGVPTDLILRDIIVQDENGKPALRTYGSGGGGGGFYDLASPTTEEMFGMPVDSEITGLTWQQIIQWMATGIAPANIIVDTDSINFGNVSVGGYSTSESRVVQKLNLTAPAIVQSNSPRFIVNNDNSNTNMSPLNIGQSDGNVTVYIKYNPTAIQSNSGIISISSTGVITKTINLQGAGIIAPEGNIFSTDGTVTQDGVYDIITGSDPLTPINIFFSSIDPDNLPYYEICGGGAGGGGARGNGNGVGGGGAGLVRYGTFNPILNMPYSVFIGAKGFGGVGSAGSGTPDTGDNGGDSYFNAAYFAGGGGGGSKLGEPGNNGGNGGGGGGVNGPNPGGIGIDNNGGAWYGDGVPYCGGSGGSSVATGGDGQFSGRGGIGFLSLITGQRFAAGGGGGCYVLTGTGPALGGIGGGGNGADGSVEFNNGGNGTTPGSGGGGGGAPDSGAKTGGNGGDGADGVFYMKIKVR